MFELLVAVVFGAAPQAESVTFEVAVQRALANHPALRIAEADTARAAALVEQARAPALPSLGASGTYTRLDNDRVLSDRVIAAKDQAGANLNLTVPLFAPNRWAQWWRASLTVDSTRATGADVRRQVALTAARAWLAVLAQHRVVTATTRARDTAKAHLEFAAGRTRGGVGNRLDELRAGQELSVSESQLESALGQLVRLQEALGVAIASDSPCDATADEPGLSAMPLVDEAVAGVEARTDVKAARARTAAAHEATTRDLADYLPLLTLVGQPFFQDPPSLTQPLFGAQLQLVLTIPLYDGGLRYGQMKERRAVASAQDAQLDAALRQARSEVRSGFEQVRHADLSLSAARDSAKQALDALELANVAYATGVSTNLDVIDAERRARDAQTQAAIAEDVARQARLDLLAAAGRFP